jgi:hypothetical protein
MDQASKDNMMPSIACWVRGHCQRRDGETWAYGNVVGTWMEAVQVIGIKTVYDSEIEDCRCDESVSHGYSTLDA